MCPEVLLTILYWETLCTVNRKATVQLQIQEVIKCEHEHILLLFDLNIAFE